MNSHLSDLPTIPGVPYWPWIVGLVTVLIAATFSQRHKLDAIPAVGSSGWLGSWWAGFKFLKNAQSLIQHGYEKYEYAPFRLAEPSRWTVIISNRDHIDEVAKASDVFSFMDAINDQLQIEHLLGHSVHHKPYHIAVIRHHLTRNLEVACPQIRDEVITSFAELLDLKEKEWKSVPALTVAQKAACRTANRIFVGLPLCRDPDWIDLNIRTTTDIAIGGTIIGILPKFMRTTASRLFTQVPQCIKRGMKLLGPIIEERQKCLNEYGSEWDDKPNDLLSWLMDEAEGPELTVESLTRHMLMTNMAAIHTTSNSFARALFYLAAHPQFVQPLREEVEAIVKKEGWSKAAFSKMRKLDSFLKECFRIEGIHIATILRKALKDFRLSDGTLIPKGTFIAVATRSVHHDKKFYANPDAFEPFRFASTREGDKSANQKHQLTSISSEYLPFGLGKAACPGRFFVASEMKSMLAHVVVTYDIKLEDGATPPPSLHFGTLVEVDPHAKLMFRHRVD